MLGRWQVQHRLMLRQQLLENSFGGCCSHALTSNIQQLQLLSSHKVLWAKTCMSALLTVCRVSATVAPAAYVCMFMATIESQVLQKHQHAFFGFRAGRNGGFNIRRPVMH
jgi:hypothetical protein